MNLPHRDLFFSPPSPWSRRWSSARLSPPPVTQGRRGFCRVRSGQSGRKKSGVVGGDVGGGPACLFAAPLTRRLPAHPPTLPLPRPRTAGCRFATSDWLTSSKTPFVFRLSAPHACFSLLPERRSILLRTGCRSSVTHFLPLSQEVMPSLPRRPGRCSGAPAGGFFLFTLFPLSRRKWHPAAFFPPILFFGLVKELAQRGPTGWVTRPPAPHPRRVTA